MLADYYSSDSGATFDASFFAFICGVVTIIYFIWLLVKVCGIHSTLREINDTLKKQRLVLPPPLPSTEPETGPPPGQPERISLVTKPSKLEDYR